MRASLLVCVALGCGHSASTPQPPLAPHRAPVAATPAAPPKPVVLLPVPAYLTSARIVAVPAGTVVSDADSGMLVAVGPEGAVLGSVAIGRAAGMVAYDPERALAYVADGAGDRIVVVDARDGTALQTVSTIRTPVEPFGVALAPDRDTLLVTTIADHTLVAYDTHTYAERWRAPLAAEPRAIAVSPDGARALVVAGGALEQIELTGGHRVTEIPFDLACDRCAAGLAFARGEAVVFLDQFRAVASFQRSVPDAIEAISTGVYGGAAMPPITQHLSFLAFSPAAVQTVAQIVANHPRSLLWDRTHDALFIAGLASDALLRLNRLTTATIDDTEESASDFRLRGAATCGPDGMAEATDGTVYVWCALSRTVLRMTRAETPDAELHESAAIAASALTAEQHEGLVLFHSLRTAINRDGALACASCHVDGRTDGHSWKIHEVALQTPSLAGRVAGTAPYKWDASDASIEASLHSTIHRLGGRGLPPRATTALVAYLVALPPSRAPTLDAAAVTRGQAVFAGSGGCTDCHAGPRLTDRALHQLDDGLPSADTPSLIGLAASAPYYHDGSAATLDALVSGTGTVHGMGNLAALTARERVDLAAYLASL